MPNLSDLTDYADKNAAIDPSITHIVVTPKEPEVKEPDESVIQNIFDRLTGSNGKERYQLWPEKVVREGLSAAHDAMTGEIPQYTIDENTGDVHTSPQMIKAAQDMSALAGTGGLGGVGSEAGTALGSSPFLRPALKYGEKLYKGKEGQQHMDLIPNELYPEFQRQALNGEDISHWNFGFTNDKGHFLDREKALQYGIDNGLIDPQAGKFGALTSTLMSDSSKPGTAIEAMANTNKPFYSAVENAIAGAKQPKADAQQWLSFLKNQPGVKQEELQHLGLDKISGSITKDDLLKAVQEGQPQIKEVVKGEVKPTLEHQIEAQESIARDYPDLHPESSEYQKLVNDYANDIAKDSNPTKYHGYQLPGGENYREMLLTLPRKEITTNDVSQKLFKRDMRNLDESERQAVSDEMRRLHETKEGGVDYRSSHWDEPNVLAHIRMNDRTIDGKKSLHLEEIQSDWHQAGRKSGYQQKEINPDDITVKKVQSTVPEGHDPSNYPGYWESFDKNGNLISRHRGNSTEAEAKAEAVKSAELNNKALIPDAPFKKTWDELALKKAITHAVKNGYDQISWTPGEAQAARYDLSKQVDKIAVPMVNDNGTRSVRVDAKSGSPFKLMVNKEGVVEGHGGSSSQFSGKPLSDVVGKEMADKIMKLEKPDEFSGDGLKVGGQGMKAFYDKMLVDKANALVKKHGGKVEKADVSVKGKNELYQKLEDEGYNPNDVDIQNILSDNGGRLPHWLTDNELTRIEKGEHLESLGSRQPVHVLKITPELREHVLKKGFPLFSAGVPIFTPVSHNPFKDNASLPNDKNTIRPEDVQSYRTYGDNNGATQEKP